MIVKQTSPVGFIVPSTILNQADTKPVRSVLLGRGLTHLISLGKDIFGKKVLNTSTIFISGKDKEDSIVIQDLSQLPLQERKNALGIQTAKDWKAWKKLVDQDPHLTLFVSDSGSVSILDRIRRNNILLQDILQGEIQRGISPDVAAAHVVSEKEVSNLENELLRPSVSGSQIKRYHPWKIDQHLIYTSRSTDLKKYPKIAKRLEQFRHLNTCREVIDGKHPWYSLHRPRNPEIFTSPKFIGLTTAKTIELIYDEKDSVLVTDAMYVFNIKPAYNPLVCMAILSSKAFLFFYRIANQGESRVIPQVKATKLYDLPYPKFDKDSNKPQHDKMVSLVERMLALHKQSPRTPQEQEMVKREIESTDKGIDRLVYELYGLSEDEIRIVEGG